MDHEDALEISEDVVASEQLLAKAIGGWQGILDSALPTLLFVGVFSLGGHNLTVALWAAGGAAVVLAAIRLVQRKSLQQVVSGLFGVAFAAWLSNRSGKAEDFFLPGIWLNALYAGGIALSIVFRHPAIGYVVGALKGDPSGWRLDAALARLYRLVSWWWVGFFSFKLVVQWTLYQNKNIEALGTLKLLMGWPLYLFMVWLTYRAVRKHA
jgi:hypothetical protein